MDRVGAGAARDAAGARLALVAQTARMHPVVAGAGPDHVPARGADQVASTCPGPGAADWWIATVPNAGAALKGALPPAGRDLPHAHARRVEELVADILRRGVQAGQFAADVEPAGDAALILGLAGRARPDQADRVRHLLAKILR